MPRNLIDIVDLSVEEINELIATAEDIIANPAKYQDACAHKQLATLFFEPSTRTRLSFESAMLALGGSVLGFSEANSSSTAKGETVGDTIHTVSCYADIIAMRHPKEGAPFAAAQVAEVPIINAGDGGHNHPTQTLTDLLTIHREKGRLDNFTIGFCGDLKFGRTVHSLVNALSRQSGIKFVFISPDELKMPDYIKENVLEIDFPGRWGGDEFMVIMRDADSEAAMKIGERIRRNVEAFSMENGMLRMSISGGIATLHGLDDKDSLFKRADDALYRAKYKFGKNNVQIIK